MGRWSCAAQSEGLGVARFTGVCQGWEAWACFGPRLRFSLPGALRVPTSAFQVPPPAGFSVQL